MHALSSLGFLIGEFGLGMLIPFIIILVSKAKAVKALVYASLSGMVGIFFMRYDLVHDTLVYPMQKMKIREYQLAPEWVHYSPSWTEWAIALGALGLMLGMYYIGENFFFLDPKEHDAYFEHYKDVDGHEVEEHIIGLCVPKVVTYLHQEWHWRTHWWSGRRSICLAIWRRRYRSYAPT